MEAAPSDRGRRRSTLKRCGAGNPGPGAVRCRPRSPLGAIDRPQIAMLVRPLVPDGHLVFVQVLDIGVAGKEPQKLVDDRPQVKLFGGQQRKPVTKVEPHLMTEHTQRAGTGAIVLCRSVAQHMVEEVQVLPHPRCIPGTTQSLTSSVHRPCALRTTSASSRTAPRPPSAPQTRSEAAMTSGAASVGQAAKPARASSGRSGTSSPA